MRGAEDELGLTGRVDGAGHVLLPAGTHDELVGAVENDALRSPPAEGHSGGIP